MAIRTIDLTVESGGYRTGGEGEWVSFTPNSNNEAFGSSNPYSISITFPSSELYANYITNIIMEYSIRMKIGDTWYTLYSDSRTMSKSSSDFSLLTMDLSSDVISALKMSPINEVGVYQDGTRSIRGTSNATGTITINYNEVVPTLTAPTNLKIVQNSDGTFTASWDAATVTNGDASNIRYQLESATDDIAISDLITALSVTCPITTYSVAMSYVVTAFYSGYSGVHATSDPVTVTFTADEPVVDNKLPIWYNGEQVVELYFNRSKVSSLVYNGTILF